MASESLPKFMFLHEDSEQMKDKRIQTVRTYEQSEGGAVERKAYKRIHNTISTSHKPSSAGIFNLQYSNKYGLLLQATENQVLIIDLNQLQGQLVNGKENTERCKRIDFSGEVFLSPSEEILAVCSDSYIQLLHMRSLPAITTVPIAIVHHSHRFLWVSETQILLWSFEGKAFLLQIDPKSLQQVSLTQMEGADCCTGVSLVGPSLLISQKMQIFVYEPGKTALLQRIDMTWNDHPWLFYDFSYIVEIFRVNVHTSPLELNTRLHLPLNKDDVLGLVLVYYDDDGEDQHERCLTFYRGNLLQGGKDMRGSESFYVAKNLPEYYFDDDRKIPFGVKVAYVNCFICIMFERSYIVYMIDPFEAYDKINIYSPNGKLELKDAKNSFFRGMATMRNLLPCQKKVPDKVSNPLLESIVNDFDGQFMMLYFAQQQTNLTIPFPASVFALTDQTLYRRFAVSSLGGIDKDKDEDIIAQMRRIKKSPFIEAPSRKINSQEGNQGRQERQMLSKREPQPKKQQVKTQQINKESTIIMPVIKRQQSVPVGSSIFATSKLSEGSKNPFPNTGNPFAVDRAASIPKTTLFSKQAAGASANVNAMFDKMPTNNAWKPSATPTSETKPLPFSSSSISGLFGPNPAGGLFKQAQPESGQATKGSLLGSTTGLKSTLFGSSNLSNTQNSIFGASQLGLNQKIVQKSKDKSKQKQGDKSKDKSVQKVSQIKTQMGQKDFSTLFKKPAEGTAVFGQTQPANTGNISFGKTENGPPKDHKTNTAQQIPKNKAAPTGIVPKHQPQATSQNNRNFVKVNVQQKKPQNIQLQQQKIKLQNLIKQQNQGNKQTPKINPSQPNQTKKQQSATDNQNYKQYVNQISNGISQLERQIQDIKKQNSSKFKTVNLKNIKQFYQSQIKNLSNPQSLYFGAPLAHILQKAEYTRKSYRHYQKLLQVSSKEQLSQTQIQAELSSLQQQLIKILYFKNFINPNREAKGSKLSSLQKQRKRLSNLFELFEGRIFDLRSETYDIMQQFTKLKDNIIHKKTQKLKRSMKFNAHGSKKFNFNEFNYNQQQKLDETRFSQSKVNKSMIRQKSRPENRKSGQYKHISLKMSEIKGNPKQILEQFQVLQSKEKSPIKSQQKRMTSTQSFAVVNQAKNLPLGIGGKSKQKIQVPKVNDKIYQMKSKQGISQVYSRSQSDLQEMELPVASRQMSKIESKPAVAQKSIFPNMSAGKETLFAASKPKESAAQKKLDTKQTKIDKGIFPQPQGKSLFSGGVGGISGKALGQPLKGDSLFGKAGVVQPKTGGPATVPIPHSLEGKKDEKQLQNDKKNQLGKPKQAQNKLPKQADTKNQKPVLSGSLFGTVDTLFGVSANQVASLFGNSKPQTLPPKQVNKTGELSSDLAGLKVQDKKQKELEAPMKMNNHFSFAGDKQKPSQGFPSKNEPILKGASLFSLPTKPLDSKPEGAANVPLLAPVQVPKQNDKAITNNNIFTAPQAPIVPKISNPSTQQNAAVSPQSGSLPAQKSNGQTKGPAPQSVANMSDAQVQKQGLGALKAQTKQQPKTINTIFKNPQQPFKKPQNNPFQPSQQKTQPSEPTNAVSPAGGVFQYQQSMGPKQSFGGPSRFMAGQGQQSTGFDPNAMSFGGGANTQKTFESLPSTNGNIFAQGQTTGQGQGQTQQGRSSTMFTGNSMFGGNNTGGLFSGTAMFSTNSSGNPASGNSFNQPANNNNNGQQSFGGSGPGGPANPWLNNAGNFAGNNSLFMQGGSNTNTNVPQGSNNSNIGAGFMQGLGNKPILPPSGANPNLMAMRK